MIKKLSILLILLLTVSLAAAGCGGQKVPVAGTPEKPVTVNELILATTTSTYDSGLLDYFLPVFNEKYNYEVKVVSLGTGQALELAKNGDADVVLVHAKKTELGMVEQGHFVDRHDVMYNDFIFVGPETDPAGIKGISDIKQLLAAFTENSAPFISRGDDSGTHKMELSLWAAAGISPEGSWYIKIGSGMGDTLRMTDEKKGYTLTDRATYLSLRNSLELDIVFEGNPQLFNQYGIMAVNPDNYPGINYEGAMLLIDFFISEEGQNLIAAYKPYGDTLFFPNAD
jgi:tungstate transport system substrate-binding protein